MNKFKILSILTALFFLQQAVAQCVPPSILGHPNNANVCAYSSGSMSIIADDATSYQWEESTDGGVTFTPLSNGAIFSNVNTSVLSITNPSFSLSGNKYRCIAIGACLPDAESNFANLNVIGPDFTTQPISVVSCENETVQFTASFVSNGFPSMSWQYSADNGLNYITVPSASPYSGEFSNTLTISSTQGSMNGYLYRMKLGNGFCAILSPPSLSALLSVDTPPAPANVLVSNLTNTSALVSWDPMLLPSSGFFEIEYRILGSGTWISAGTVPNATFSSALNNLSPGTDYEVKVQSNCSAASGGLYSATIGFSTLPDCSNTMVLNAVATSPNSATINWLVLPTTQWYEFRYKANSSSTWIFGGTLGGTATSKFLSGLLDNTLYDIQAKRYCSGTPNSQWSATLTIQTDILSSCSLPPAATASLVTGLSAAMNWPAVSNAAWYEFRYKPTSSSTWLFGGTAGGAATSKFYSGLTPNTNYTFEAKTYCSNGIGSAWGSTTFTTGQLVGCELPPTLNSTAISSLNSIQISWPTVAGAAWYSFQYKESTSSTWISGGTVSNSAVIKTFSGLLVGTFYDFQIRTHCSNGINSAWSVTSQFATNSGSNTILTESKESAAEQAVKTLLIESNTFFLYPNPTKESLHLRMEWKSSQPIMAELMDVNGRTVFTTLLISENENITFDFDLSGLNSGIYFLYLSDDLRIIERKKVMKE